MGMDFGEAGGALSAAGPRAPSFDPAKYRAFLNGSDLTDAQKDEYLCTLWMILESFVDLAFDSHPVQKCCGQRPAIPLKNLGISVLYDDSPTDEKESRPPEESE